MSLSCRKHPPTPRHSTPTQDASDELLIADRFADAFSCRKYFSHTHIPPIKDMSRPERFVHGEDEAEEFACCHFPLSNRRLVRHEQ